MTPPGTFDRVYAALKQRLRDGCYRPGERLEPAALAEELNSSVTPIRDALHRLVGERLIEAPRQTGFRVPMLTETMLRHLYGWHQDLLLLALLKHGTAFPGDGDGASEEEALSLEHERQNALFLAIIRSAGNPEHLFAFAALTDRLEAVQQVEDRLLEGTEAETSEIFDALRSNDRKGLRRSLARYHRRRNRLVPELLAELQDA